MIGQVAELPALGWKLLNQHRLSDENVEKFAAQNDLQEVCLDHLTEVSDTHAQREATAP